MAETASEAALRGEVNKFICLCGSRREQVANLVDYLDKQGLYTAPASASHHANHYGGLIEHSINVTRVLLTIKKRLLDGWIFPDEFSWMDQKEKEVLPKIMDESCVIVGLLHDVHKICDGFGRVNYAPNVGKGGKVSEAKPYEVNKDMMAFSGSFKSALIVSKFIDLQEHELQAIAYHDGQYISSGREIAMKEHPLTLMLHFADMWSASLIEDTESWLYRAIAESKFCK